MNELIIYRCDACGKYIESNAPGLVHDGMTHALCDRVPRGQWREQTPPAPQPSIEQELAEANEKIARLRELLIWIREQCIQATRGSDFGHITDRIDDELNSPKDGAE